MSEFFIQLTEMSGIENKLGRVTDTTVDVSNTVSNASTGLGPIGLGTLNGPVSKIVSDLSRNKTTLEMLESSLRSIVKRYMEAENGMQRVIYATSTIDEQKKVNVPFDDTVWYDDFKNNAEEVEREKLKGFDDFMKEQYLKNIGFSIVIAHARVYDLSDYMYCDPYGNWRVDINSLPDDVKAEFIALYEETHPDQAKLVNDFLSVYDQALSSGEMSEDDIKKFNKQVEAFKLAAYTAVEPYKTIFFENVGDVTLIDAISDTGSSAMHKRNTDTINLTHDQFAASTLYHEFFHYINDKYATGTSVVTDTFTYDGKTLKEMLLSDARQNVQNYVYDHMENSSLSDNLNANEQLAVCNKIEEYIFMCEDFNEYKPNFEDLTYNGKVIATADEMREIYEDISTLPTEGGLKYDSNSVGDIYGLLTGNYLCSGGGGHSARYGLANPKIEISADNYNTTVADEFVAEFGAQHMMPNSATANTYYEAFDESLEGYDAYIATIASMQGH